MDWRRWRSILWETLQILLMLAVLAGASFGVYLMARMRMHR